MERAQNNALANLASIAALHPNDFWTRADYLTNLNLWRNTGFGRLVFEQRVRRIDAAIPCVHRNHTNLRRFRAACRNLATSPVAPGWGRIAEVDGASAAGR